MLHVYLKKYKTIQLYHIYKFSGLFLTCSKTFTNCSYNILSKYIPIKKIVSQSRCWFAMSSKNLRKASIWVRISTPSPPHKFLLVLHQKVRICITLHQFELLFRCAPVISACCVWMHVTGLTKCREWFPDRCCKPSLLCSCQYAAHWSVCTTEPS